MTTCWWRGVTANGQSHYVIYKMQYFHPFYNSIFVCGGISSKYMYDKSWLLHVYNNLASSVVDESLWQ